MPTDGSPSETDTDDGGSDPDAQKRNKAQHDVKADESAGGSHFTQAEQAAGEVW